MNQKLILSVLTGLIVIVVIVLVLAWERNAFGKEIAVEAPSRIVYESAKSELKNIIVDSKIPTTVRLAFHDCVGPNGCNGCVNINKPSNAALNPLIEMLVMKREQKFKTISNADFWQIAGIVALEAANTKVDITFKGGRVDCLTSPYHDGDTLFPLASMNRKEMMKWFKGNDDGFGMNEEQVTALMGAHSLGRARRKNTGYNGAWTPTREKLFDNEMYKLLQNNASMFKNERQKDPSKVAPGDDLKFQWTLSGVEDGTFIMLNTDMELAYDIDVDNSGSGTKCMIPSQEEKRKKSNQITSGTINCPVAVTKKLVTMYAKDENAFLKDFKNAYEMMMTVKITTNLTIPQ